MTKFCKDCKYYFKIDIYTALYIRIPPDEWDDKIHKCYYVLKEDAPDLIDGSVKRYFPESIRKFREFSSDSDNCGPDAKYFEPKPSELPKVESKPQPWYMKAELRHYNKPWFQFW